VAPRLISAPIAYGFRRAIDHRLRTDANRMLFIVGHMRSGSSLLVHLLANNPHILGYGETHQRHDSPADFSRVAWRVLRSFGRVWPRERYLMDKVLHAQHGLSAELLRWGGTRTILLVRSPESTIPSILKLGLARWPTEEAATDYYVDRLAAVAALAGELGPRRCRFLTYDQLVSATEATLRSLTRFLELPDPITEEYDLLWSTGRYGVGDSSERIYAGRIVRGADRAPEAGISGECLARAREAYRRCVERSAAHAGVLDGVPA
jgi:hypothetical protein